GNAPGASPLAIENGLASESAPAAKPAAPSPKVIVMPRPKVNFVGKDLADAVEVVRQMDPVGVACRTLQECLLAQIRHHQQVEEDLDGDEGPNRQMLSDCAAIITSHLRALQRKEYRDIARAISRPLEAVLAAVEYVKRLDPKPGLRYNIEQTRLIEPDVAFVKQGEEYLVLMNDEDLPQLCLNPAYKKLLHRGAPEQENTCKRPRVSSSCVISSVKASMARRATALHCSSSSAVSKSSLKKKIPRTPCPMSKSRAYCNPRGSRSPAAPWPSTGKTCEFPALINAGTRIDGEVEHAKLRPIRPGAR